MRRLAPDAGWVVLPALASVLVGLAAAPTGAGRFQACLAALVAGVIVGAFATGGGLVRSALRLVAASVLAGTAAAFGGADGLGVAALVLACGVAASGLAAVGRAVGAPGVAAGAVAACVLWVAMGGLFWADGIAAHLPRERRRPFRQAVLHVDPALAMAYGGARYDRLRAGDVYEAVPLASSLYDRPTAPATAASWTAVGLLAWGVVGLLAARERRGTGSD